MDGTVDKIIDRINLSNDVSDCISVDGTVDKIIIWVAELVRTCLSVDCLPSDNKRYCFKDEIMISFMLISSPFLMGSSTYYNVNKLF